MEGDGEVSAGCAGPGAPAGLRRGVSGEHDGLGRAGGSSLDTRQDTLCSTATDLRCHNFHPYKGFAVNLHLLRMLLHSETF